MNEQTTIAELTGDLVIYRDLQPYDRRLPGLAELRDELGIPASCVPRKRDLDYARVIMALLQRIQLQRHVLPLDRLLVVGDTTNDRQMAAHLCSASGLPVAGFIGVDDLEVAPTLLWEGDTATANRWALLDTWLEHVQQQAMQADRAVEWSRVALVLDIDKTLLGPRGRGDAPINAARAEGAVQVAADILALDVHNPDDLRIRDTFRLLYETICQKEYHGLTLDNQDYVVFITLLLAGQVLSLEELQQGMQTGIFASFTNMLTHLESRIPAHLRTIYTEVRAADAAGDPTPFKAFRHAEFAATVGRMIAGELTLCREVVDVARGLVQLGACCLAASDKPSEASLPSDEQVAAGLLPLHHTLARVQ